LIRCFSNVKKDLILIESSPFLVCLQTAAVVAKAFGVASIQLNYQMSGWQGEKLFKETPLPLLEYT
jgi:hypothetical protein